LVWSFIFLSTLAVDVLFKFGASQHCSDLPVINHIHMCFAHEGQGLQEHSPGLVLLYFEAKRCDPVVVSETE
jgi:hypothetical protein